MVGVRKKCTGARNVFFGSDGVDLVFDFVAFVGNGEKAGSVNGAIGEAEPGNGEARVVPSEVNRISDEKEENERRKHPENQSGDWR